MKSLLGIDLPFYSYGILMGIAFILGIFLFKHNLKNTKDKCPPLIDILLVISIFGILGARINYIILFPQYYNSLRDCLALHEGGLVFYGGFILAVIALFFYSKIKKISFLLICDYMVPSLAIGHAIGRIGCLINDCCYGVKTDFIKIYHLKNDPENFFRHPTQLYEIIYLIILAVIFTFIIRTRWPEKFGNRGILTNLYVISYSVLRFFNEFLRDDDRGGFFTTLNLSPAQITSIVLTIIGILFLIVKKSNIMIEDKKQ